MATPWLDVGALITARLQAQVPTLAAAIEAATLDAALAVPVLAPSVLVVFDGDEPADVLGQSESGDVQIVQLRWLVIVAVAAARSVPGGASARAAAAGVITAVVEALAGWRPAAGMGTMIRAGAPAPSVRGVTAYFPQLYRTVVVL